MEIQDFFTFDWNLVQGQFIPGENDFTSQNWFVIVVKPWSSIIANDSWLFFYTSAFLSLFVVYIFPIIPKWKLFDAYGFINSWEFRTNKIHEIIGGKV